MIIRLLGLLLIAGFLAHDLAAAKYASDPFSLGAGARGLGMGGAVLAGPFDGSAAYWNPAGLHRAPKRQIVAMHAETFGSLLNHDVIGIVDPQAEASGRVRAWGAYLYYIGGGGIKITTLNQFDRPVVLREESHADLVLACALSGVISQLDIGVTAKVIYRDLGTESGVGLSLDIGGLYPLGSGLTLGMVISDVTTGVIRYGGGSSIAVSADSTFETTSNVETIYPALKPAFLFERRFNQFIARLAGSGEIRFENYRDAAQYWSGSLSLDTHYGLEIGWKEMLFGRAGLDIGRFTAGAGVAYRRFSVDLAYLHHDDLDNTYRVSAGFQF